MASIKITVIRGNTAAEQEVTETTTGFDLFGDDRATVAVNINGQLRDLARPVLDDTDGDISVAPVLIGSQDGLNIIRHSAAHVVAQAVQTLYAERSEEHTSELQSQR